MPWTLLTNFKTWAFLAIGALSLLVVVANLKLAGAQLEIANMKAASAAADAAAAQAQAESIQAARATEAAWNDAKSKLEAQTRERENTIHGLRIANGRLLSATGGLLDRNGRPVGRDGVSCAPVTAGQPVEPASGCRLSDKVTSDLLDLALDADRAATYAQTCQAWVTSITHP